MPGTGFLKDYFTSYPLRRAAAYTALAEFVVARRRVAARSVAAAAQAGGAGGTALQEFPEFMLPFLLQARSINAVLYHCRRCVAMPYFFLETHMQCCLCNSWCQEK